MEDAQRRDVALFRYALVRQAADPVLSNAERGRLVRDLAARDHVGPDGQRKRVARSTLDEWIRAYRSGGFDALVPAPGSRQPRTRAALLELAVTLKEEKPRRTAAQIQQIMLAATGAAPSVSTIQRHLRRSGHNLRGDGSAPQTFGRFEAEQVNDLWIGDALHGPAIGGRKTYLFAFIDDHSRLLAGYRWGRAEDSLRLEAALRRGLASRGIPRRIYVDNGSAFVAAPLQRACAVLGVQLVHSRPGQPAGRGKIERFFRTVRDQFLVELDLDRVTDLDDLNRLFVAWVERIYHRRAHTETGQTPLERFAAAGVVDLPIPGLLREAFLWAEQRTVTTTALVSLHGNRYEVDPVLAGRKVQLVFDPFDLSEVEVRFNEQSFGLAAPHVLGTHVHPKAASGLASPDDMPAAHSGIDYLALVAAEHETATRQTINFADLPDDTGDLENGDDGDASDDDQQGAA
jgi:putative transposase